MAAWTECLQAKPPMRSWCLSTALRQHDVGESGEQATCSGVVFFERLGHSICRTRLCPSHTTARRRIPCTTFGLQERSDLEGGY